VKLLLVIDHFGSGGAQRQIVELACGLKRRGHAVEMFTYFPERRFFRHRIDELRIVVHEYHKGLGFSLQVASQLAVLIKHHDFDAVISFLGSPNIYAELAKVIAPRAKLVVSERTSFHDDKSRIGAFVRRAMHAIADNVVANSRSQCNWLRRKWWLRHKVSCIYNGVEPGSWDGERAAPESGGSLRLVAVGRMGPEKNALNLLKGLEVFYGKWGYVPRVTWIGGRDDSKAGRFYCRQVDELLERSSRLQRNWQWLGESENIPELLRQYDAMIHPSFYEGLPNVVCEALAAGMPVLASNVCDHPILVAEGERGFLFNPIDPVSIACAIKRLTDLNDADWRTISANSRRYAVEYLSVDKMVSTYEDLLSRLLLNPSVSHRAS
jgi:glycosyltransferase involved in cell wall biosynthesis